MFQEISLKAIISYVRKVDNLGKPMTLTEREIVEKVETSFSFPPLEVKKLLVEPELATATGAQKSRIRVAMEVDLILLGEERCFLVEVKRQSTPKTLDDGVRQIQNYARALADSQSDVRYFPMIVVPYLGPEALDRLIAENVSGIDLSGNGVVIVPGEWFIYRSGAPNKYPSSAPIKNVFRGTSSLVARVFLMRQRFASVNEVYEEIKRRGGEITLPTVSKALKALEEELIISRDEEAIKLIDAGRLLEQLARNYRRPIARRCLRGKFADRDAALSNMAGNTKAKNIQLVGDDPTRYVVMPGAEQRLTVYTPSIETALHGVEFTETNRFPEVEVWETDEPIVYFDRREEDGFFWTSPVEVYLSLLSGGKRESETAEQIRSNIEEFRYYM
jgi:DNA-binding transcriptional ArsR family regulator